MVLVHWAPDLELVHQFSQSTVFLHVNPEMETSNKQSGATKSRLMRLILKKVNPSEHFVRTARISRR